MRRRLLALIGFLAGIFAGSVLYRRTIARRRPRVDVYFDDGAMITYDDGSPEADSLLPIAHDALSAADARR
jgi:hypothetical protein